MTISIQKIKNFLIVKRTFLLVLLFCVSLGLITPLFKIYAIDWWTPIGIQITEKIFGIDIWRTPGEMLNDIGNGIVIAIFSLLHVIGLVFLGISSALLLKVTSPDFISLGYTTNNPFVTQGWTLVRDFSNMFIILILAAIALGTALRIKEYEIKKLLPTLIAVALLINFTPVICGLIIDASNIIMNTFLDALGAGFQGAITIFIDVLSNLKEQFLSKGNPLETLGFGISSLVFVFVAAFIFFAFALLFFFRYAALWILVILSPIAFLCYILPQTKKIWSMWWNQFIQWCFIGVIGAFFLYLGEQILGLKDKISSSSTGDLKDFTGMDELFPFIIPIIILIIGFFATLKTSAIGADRILSFAQGTGKKIAGWAKGTTPVKWTKEKAERLAQKIPETLGPTKKMRIESKAKNIEKNKQESENKKKLYDSMSNDEVITLGTRIGASQSEKTAMMMVLKERKKINKLEERLEKNLKDPDKAKDKLKDYMKITYDYAGNAAVKDIEDQRPDLVADLEEIKTGKVLADRSKTIGDEVRKKQPVKFRQETNAKALENTDVFLAMTTEQVNEIGFKGSLEQKEALKLRIKDYDSDAKLKNAKSKMRPEEYNKLLDKIKLIQGW